MTSDSNPACAVVGAADGPVGELSAQESATTALRTKAKERRNLERIIVEDPVRWRAISLRLAGATTP